jgi:hypothetical protein
VRDGAYGVYPVCSFSWVVRLRFDRQPGGASSVSRRPR